MTFGPTGDTNLYRSAADVLKTDDAMAVGPYLAVGSATVTTGDVRLPATASVYAGTSLALGLTTTPVMTLSTALITIANGYNLQFGASSGTKLGLANNVKLAFWGATPVVQNAGWSATAGYTATRTFNPEATSVTELARVVGTLVDTLKTYGLLGA